VIKVVLFIGFILSLLTGMCMFVILPYKGTWVERLWEQARYQRRIDVERGIYERSRASKSINRC
jgi:hypothetical protein